MNGVTAEHLKPSDHYHSPELRRPYQTGAIIGLGNTGRMYADRLRLTGMSLTAQARLWQIEELRRYYEERDIAVTDHLVETLRENPQVIILAIPNPVRRTLEGIRAHIPTTTTTLVLPQNGVEADDAAREVFWNTNVNVVAASLFTSVGTNDEGGVDYNRDKLRIGLSPVRGDPEEVVKVASLFEQSGFRTATVDNTVAMRYTKLLYNSLALTGAIVGLTKQATIEDRELAALEIAALHDRMRILRRAGIPVLGFPWTKGLKSIEILNRIPDRAAIAMRRQLASLFAKEGGDKLSTTAVKIRDHKPTEIDWYTKPWVDLGLVLGRSPVDEAIREVVRANGVGLGDRSVEERRALMISEARRRIAEAQARGIN